MPEFLIEIISEEIPSRMQAAARAELQRRITDGLAAAGLKANSAQAYSTPRRIVVVIDDLPAEQPDISEVRKGPKVGAPDKAIQGFLKSVGLTIDQAETEETDKGSYYVARIEKKGGPTRDVLAQMMPEVITAFHWPKSMRWGAGRLRWVRPLQAINCVFGGERVAFSVDGIESTAQTSGHRFMAPAPIDISDFNQYSTALNDAHVILDQDKRRDLISSEAARLAQSKGLELVDDPGLIDEVTGLVEWPVVLMGEIDADFVAPPPDGLPAEVLESAMRTHQRYFSLRDPVTGRPAPYFIVVANLAASDSGKSVIAGNERVLRARLSDAKFFWEQDRKDSLESRVPELKNIIFHAQLGTLLDKAERMAHLAEVLSKAIPDCDHAKAARAARLAKADLSSEMVYEFPEVQGIMGRYYGLADGEDEGVANAVRDHYAPVGPSAAVPAAPESIAVALADKIDTLVGFFGIDQRPTGSKDPFALRRAALGVIRIILDNGLRLRLTDTFLEGYKSYGKLLGKPDTKVLLGFFADRLKVHLRDLGVRHDYVDAVFALPDQDDLVLIVRQVKALGEFTESPDGADLLTAYKRAANILRIEQKKDKCVYDGAANAKLFSEKEEKDLSTQLARVSAEVTDAMGQEDFTGAMTAMSTLRNPVDAFFDKVTVNADDVALRENRLKLLSQITKTLEQIADLSELEG